MRLTATRFLTALLIAACSLSALAVPVRAGEVVIGNERISYTDPPDLIPARKLFPVNLKKLDKAFDMKTVIFASYVPADYREQRKNNQYGLPEYYLHMTYDESYVSDTMGETAFSIFTSALNAMIGTYYEREGFKNKLSAIFTKATKQNVTIESLENLGCIDKHPGVFSMMAKGQASVETPSGKVPFPVAMVVTLHLAKEKPITTLQIKHTPTPKDVKRFRKQALERVKEIWGLETAEAASENDE